MKAIQILTVKALLPLFKGEEKAEKIELLKLEENDFDLVVAKGIHNVGDKIIFIQPDYCLPDNEFFEAWVKPDGDYSKSYLGKVEGKPSRIRAKKFNMSLVPNGDPVYSNGIIVPFTVLKQYLELISDIQINNPEDLDKLDLETFLGIYKYVKQEDTFIENFSLAFPEGIYKTDEENFKNISGKLSFPCILYGTEKIDGSSITIGYDKVKNEEYICSRNIRKRITVPVVIGKRKKTLLETLMFWKKPNLDIIENTLNKDSGFVKYGYPYLQKLLSCNNSYTNGNYDGIILRGEIAGASFKGSGNKNNMYKGHETFIKFFGVDIIENGIAKRMKQHDFELFCDLECFPRVKKYFGQTFNSKEELLETCNEIFKENPNLEGIVVRDNENTFSAKIMNDLYDSKK